MTLLRKEGIAAASKKTSRTASDGLLGIGVADSGRKVVVVEVNSETDFVARNDLFRSLVFAHHCLLHSPACSTNRRKRSACSFHTS